MLNERRASGQGVACLLIAKFLAGTQQNIDRLNSLPAAPAALHELDGPQDKLARIKEGLDSNRSAVARTYEFEDWLRSFWRSTAAGEARPLSPEFRKRTCLVHDLIWLPPG